MSVVNYRAGLVPVCCADRSAVSDDLSKANYCQLRNDHFVSSVHCSCVDIGCRTAVTRTEVVFHKIWSVNGFASSSSGLHVCILETPAQSLALQLYHCH